ncbi:hypothetical protein FRC07_005241 [Ceratobasidium sp. 392]|nr:hypothetical protein FRC07_005241 [Ceratobasidium sp. 392]
MTHIPSDEEVLEQLAKLRVDNPTVGMIKAVTLIKERNPDWGLSTKRLRNISKLAEPQQSDNLMPVVHEPHNNQVSLVPNQLADESPMSALMLVLERFMAGGNRKAAKRAAQVDLTFKMSPEVEKLLSNPSAFAKTNLTHMGVNFPMRSCKLAVTIVLQIVAPDELLYECLAWSSRSLGGLPTVAQIRARPSASLPIFFARAKEAALKQQQSTALAVNIVDVEMMERGEGFNLGSLNHMSFSHAFVAFVGPEGMRILQAWGEHGYSLAENLRSPASRLRDWTEAEAFVNRYDQLTKMETTGEPIHTMPTRNALALTSRRLPAPLDPSPSE